MQFWRASDASIRRKFRGIRRDAQVLTGYRPTVRQNPQHLNEAELFIVQPQLHQSSTTAPPTNPGGAPHA